MTTSDFINDLNARYFDGELSADFVAEIEKLPVDRPDVFAFVERMFRFMKQGGVPATDLSTMTGEILGTLLARILPGAWEGRVPPITLPGRHMAMDQLLSSEAGLSGERTMLDIGCGFPPYTTLDTAKAFPNWHITGVDPSLPVYLIYDDQGNYATLDEHQQTVYFQPAIPTVENWNELLADSKRTKRRFEALLHQLIHKPDGGPDDLPRLEKDPIRHYESEHLGFIRGGIGQVDIPTMDVIRCFNVLFYFDDSFYQDALSWFSDQLNDGGLLLIGANWAASTESYYNVYQKRGGELVDREFAFSLDCICPLGIVPWYANYDDDRQSASLMKYMNIIRSDKAFMDAFYALHDAGRAEKGICPRDENGYYGVVNAALGPNETWMGAAQLLHELNSAGLNQMAAEVLRASGLDAGVNPVGHIVVR
jgi:SAM-dependent methyltransferase